MEKDNQPSKSSYWEERVLFEMRKSLFNAYSQPKRSSGGLDKSVNKLIWKPPADQPDLLNPAVQELIKKRFQNAQEWLKEKK